MSTTVTMPQLGETVTEGTILAWAKQPGDTIEEDEVLLEISTDKVDTEVPSPASGVLLEILVQEGETVEVGAPLAVIGEPGEEAGEAGSPAEEPAADEAAEPSGDEQEQPEPAPVAEEPSGEEQPREEQPAPAASGAPAPDAEAGEDEPAGDGPMRSVLSPVVRKLAGEHDIDLDRVPGTGTGGRITRRDVLGYIERRDAGEEPAAEPAAAPEPAVPETKVTYEPAEPEETAAEEVPATVPAPAEEAAPAAAAEPAAEEAPPAERDAEAAAATAAGPGDDVRDITRLRRRVAENMVNAKRTAAHVWTSVEVDFERVERVRQRHKGAWKEQEGYSLTYLPFISRATIDALDEYPAVNSSFLLDEGKHVFHGRVNLGVAVDMNQEGLIVVTIRNADGLGLKGIAREVADKAAAVRDRRINPDDITGSTFTITNPGPFGSFMSAPIINVPNVAILSTDTVVKRPTVVTDSSGADSIAIHHIGYLGLTWDHRAFDGSTAVLFLRRIKENLETWDWEQELA